MKYKTQTAVIRDYHNGILDEATAMRELETVKTHQRIRRDNRKLNHILQFIITSQKSY